MRKRVKIIKASIAIHCANDYFDRKTAERSNIASCGFVIQMHSPKYCEKIELQLAACSEPASLYALATLHLIKLLPANLGNSGYRIIVYLPECKFDERLQIAQNNISNGGLKSNGEAANDMHIWKPLVEYLDLGIVQFIYVNKAENEEHWKTLSQLSLVAKAVALRSKANNFAHKHSEYGTLFSETTVYRTPPKEQRRLSKP